MSVISQTYSIIIDRGISAPGHGKDVVDGLNAVDKRYIYINWEHFSAALQADINSTSPSRPRHAVFHSFLSGDRKPDAATTTAHIKCLLSLLKKKSIDNIIKYNMGKH